MEQKSMVQTPVKPLTLQTFLAMPDTKPASEFINGKILQKPMPQGEHSILQRDLCFAITQSLKPDKLGAAFPELRCSFGGRAVVPDVTVFRDDRIPRKPNGRIENIVSIAPDWTIEILSPDQSQTKVIRNILHCIEHGTSMGWLIDPEESCIFVYNEAGTVKMFDQAEDQLPIPEEFAAAVQLSVGEIFGWLVV
jgi:Uma2 family endonuclease